MAKKSPIAHKPRDDTGFNPFEETQKIIVFSQQAGRLGYETFTVIVRAGTLEWTGKKLNKKHPGFIAVIDRRKLGIGLTNKEWYRLEGKIAIEMCKQRKAW